MIPDLNLIANKGAHLRIAARARQTRY